VTKIAIIDLRDSRRERLAESATGRATVHPVRVGSVLSETTSRPDLVLLHVGRDQEAAGDSIHRLLERFHDSLTLCYSGGFPVEAATSNKSPSVAVFPAFVEMDDVGVDFVRTVNKVLDLFPQRASLEDGWFRSAVKGFDAILEAKLDVLSSILQREEPAASRKRLLRKHYPSAFGTDGNLLVHNESFIESVGQIRRVLFHE